METFHCEKCRKNLPREDWFAQDGEGHDACWRCFKAWGWRVFGKDFSPHRDRP